MAKRSEAIPGAIAAGCDMILFANVPEEDIANVTRAVESGYITEERLSDALHRILGLKARMHLYDDAVRYPDKSRLATDIGLDEYKEYSRQAAEECMTLVKDTRGNLPVNPETQKNIWLVYVSPHSMGLTYKPNPSKQMLIEELEKAGFNVDVCPDYNELESKGPDLMNFVEMLTQGPREDFIKNHDFALLVLDVKGYAQENNVRVRWSCNHSKEMPWYNDEIPTIGVSLNYTNHLIDVPQVHTFINAYGNNREHIETLVAKLTGKSEFKGKADENVFCDRWETRL